jgi:hypothetical protein
VEDSETQRSQQTKFYVLVGAAFLWAAALCIWLVTQKGHSLEFLPTLLLHPWVVMSSVLGVKGLFWIAFWRRAKKIRLPRLFVFLKLGSDALLIALAAGLFLWKWPPDVIIILGFALAASYGARFIRGIVQLAQWQRER